MVIDVPIVMTVGDSRVKIEKLDLGLTPAELYDRLSGVSECSFLLESAVGSERTVSYSFMGFQPEYVVRCVRGHVEGGPDCGVSRDEPIPFLNRLSSKDPIKDARFPFLGGLVGYFSYDFARFIEPSTMMLGGGAFPDFELGMYKEGIIFDHSSFQAYYFSVDGADRLRLVLEAGLPQARDEPFRTGELVPSMPQERYEKIVSICRDRIAAGEAFQIVASRSLSSICSGNSLDLYRALRELNPSPYMFYFDFGGRVGPRLQPGDAGHRQERGGHHLPDRRDQADGDDPQGEARLSGGDAGGREGKSGALHARRPGQERRRQGVRDRFGARAGVHAGGGVQPRTAHGIQGAGDPGTGQDGVRGVLRGVPRRYGVRCP